LSGLEQYAQTFLQEGIDGRFLITELDEEMLLEMQIEKKLHRRRIIAEICKLQEDSVDNADRLPEAPPAPSPRSNTSRSQDVSDSETSVEGVRHKKGSTSSEYSISMESDADYRRSFLSSGRLGSASSVRSDSSVGETSPRSSSRLFVGNDFESVYAGRDTVEPISSPLRSGSATWDQQPATQLDQRDLWAHAAAQLQGIDSIPLPQVTERGSSLGKRAKASRNAARNAVAGEPIYAEIPAQAEQRFN